MQKLFFVFKTSIFFLYKNKLKGNWKLAAPKYGIQIFKMSQVKKSRIKNDWKSPR